MYLLPMAGAAASVAYIAYTCAPRPLAILANKVAKTTGTLLHAAATKLNPDILKSRPVLPMTHLPSNESSSDKHPLTPMPEDFDSPEMTKALNAVAKKTAEEKLYNKGYEDALVLCFQVTTTVAALAFFVGAAAGVSFLHYIQSSDHNG